MCAGWCPGPCLRDAQYIVDALSGPHGDVFCPVCPGFRLLLRTIGTRRPICSIENFSRWGSDVNPVPACIIYSGVQTIVHGWIYLLNCLASVGSFQFILLEGCNSQQLAKAETDRCTRIVVSHRFRSFPSGALGTRLNLQFLYNFPEPQSRLRVAGGLQALHRQALSSGVTSGAYLHSPQRTCCNEFWFMCVSCAGHVFAAIYNTPVIQAPSPLPVQ